MFEKTWTGSTLAKENLEDAQKIVQQSYS